MYGIPPSDPGDLTSVASALRQKGFEPIARVMDSTGAADLAVALRSRLVAIRCVERTSPEDHTALATMISEGDFIWGAIVYSESAEPDPLGLIESFHVDQLDQLVFRLLELREAFDEAR